MRRRVGKLAIVIPGILMLASAIGVFITTMRERTVGAPRFSVTMRASESGLSTDPEVSRAGRSKRNPAQPVGGADRKTWIAEEATVAFGLQVFGDDGKPLKNAKVRFFQRPSFQLSQDNGDLLLAGDAEGVEVDERGLAELKSRKGYFYDVVVTADGYPPRRYRLRDPGTKKVQMQKAGTILGRVVDEQQAPVAGIAVELIHDGAESAYSVTDADGNYEFGAVAPTNQAIVQIASSSFLRATKNVSIEAGDRVRRDFGLKPGDVLSVEVVDRTEQRLFGATVVLVELNSGIDVGTVTTNAGGTATFECLNDRMQYAIAVRLPGIGAARRLVRSTPQAVDGRMRRIERVVLDGEGIYAANITTRDGHPIPGARVILESEAMGPFDASRDRHVVDCDEFGNLRVEGLIPGVDYSAFVYHSQFAVSVSTEVKPTSTSGGEGGSENENGEPQPIVLDPKGEVSGVVVNEAGEPVGGAIIFLTIKAVPDGTPGSVLVGRTDSNGAYSFPNLPPGTVELHAITISGGATSDPMNVGIDSEQPISSFIIVH